MNGWGSRPRRDRRVSTRRWTEQCASGPARYNGTAISFDAFVTDWNITTMSSPPGNRPARPYRKPRPGARPYHGVRSGRRQQPLAEGRTTGLPVEVTIDRIVGDGKGIGFADGMTVFIPRTAPGDRVRATIHRRQGAVGHGEIDEILEPSPMRIEPPITDYDASGGCDLQHIAYGDQLALKADILTDSLRRIGRIDPVPDVTVTPSALEWGYRSRAEFQLDQKTGAVGYFAPGSHRVVDVEESPVLTAEVQALLTTLRDDVQARLVPKGAREYRAVTGDTGSVLERTNSPRSRPVMRQIGDDLFRYAAECFFQANIPVTKDLLQRVIEIADEASGADGVCLDLYCGVGLFTVPLARRFERVVGVESFHAAARYAQLNLEDAQLDNGRIVEAAVEHWLAGDRSPLGKIALAIFDPPRSGAGKETMRHLLRLKPAHVAAVSCDPATFSRDIRELLDGGYEFANVQAFDMFPQTHHFEIVGHLRRIEP